MGIDARITICVGGAGRGEAHSGTPGSADASGSGASLRRCVDGGRGTWRIDRDHSAASQLKNTQPLIGLTDLRFSPRAVEERKEGAHPGPELGVRPSL